MVSKVQKWGNSQGLRLTRQILEDSGIKVGDEVEVSATDGAIKIQASRPVRGRYKLDDLLDRIPKGYRPEEVDTGKSVGGEAW